MWVGLKIVNVPQDAEIAELFCKTALLLFFVSLSSFISSTRIKQMFAWLALNLFLPLKIVWAIHKFIISQYQDSNLQSIKVKVDFILD